MSFLQDLFSRPWRFFRDRTANLLPEKKGNFGVEITGQNNVTAQYSLTSNGDEQGWHYTPGSSARGFGSWAQAVPAILNKATNTIQPIKDKSMALDTNYPIQTVSGSPGNSNNTIRVAEIDGDNVPGIIVTCLNHSSQEKIFIPMSEGGGA